MTAPLAHYESFVIGNASTIATIESSLRSVTWILPGRFKDAELASEALTSFLNLLSLYHDTLLARRLKHIQQTDPKSAKTLLPPSPHTRYTKASSERDPKYKWASRLLEIIRYTQLVLEMGLKRTTGNNGRWRGIVIIEMIRAILRLTIMRTTRRPVVSPPLPEREIDPASLPALAEQPASPPPPPREQNRHANGNGNTATTTPTHLENNHVPFSSGKAHPLLTTPPTSLTQTTIEDYLLPKALTPSSLRDPRFLLRTLSGPTDWAAEILYILRPLIYVLLLRPSRKPISSFRTPVAVSIMIEVAVRYLRAMPPASASLERAEYARRDRELFWYLFRGEIWNEWMRPKLLGLAQRTSGVPLLALVSAVVGDWVPLIDQYHYYTAT